ncbi:hypothetical protein BESB_062390 [Besnoitia besnoiti]|uniref:E3 UFM1-protein ligase 1-like N-terminal domain-containing protein n=1 Tax=Besnoitia besnoiti TaxID=94643 RepID=A0A2A9MIZ6_BESBE|nr:hypothetical protein BESB_062390 [Besnoitia besnoiti]PFH35352.1 hypothetical protein BESB_062390 [Besnoitia besnoiti]
MVSLEELQRQFMAVQEAAPTQTLSERCCVDIVVRLMEQKKIQLLTTSNGKEFITADALAQEIRSHLVSQSGRVNVIEMATVLGLSPDVVEAKTEEITRKARHLTLLGGDLISTLYLNNVAAEIEEFLEEKGQLTIAELSQKYSLPADFMRQEVQERLGSVIHGELRDQYLTTSHFARRVEGVVRGALTGACRPVALADLSAVFSLPSDSVTAAAAHLLRTGEVHGRLQSGVFTPACFARSQSDKVASFYRANAFVPFSLAKESGFSDARSYLQKEFPEGIPLATVYVHPQLVAPLQANIQEAVSASSWADLSSLLPSVFTSEDMRMLLVLASGQAGQLSGGGASPSRKPLPVLACDDGIVLSQGFLDALCEAAAPFLSRKALEAEKNKVPAAKPVEVRQELGTGHLVQAALRRWLGAATTPRTKATSAVGGERRAAGEGKALAEARRKKNVAAALLPSAGVTLADIKEACASPAQESSDNALADLWLPLPTSVQESVWENVQGRLNTHYQNCIAESRRSLREQQRAKTERKAADLQEEFEGVFLAVRAFETLGILEDAKHPLVVNLFKASVGPLVDALVEAAVAEATSEPPQVTAQNRRQCVEKAGRAGAEVEGLLRACDAAQKRAGADVVDALQAAAEDAHLLFRTPDKRRVKQLVTAKKAGAQEQLAGASACDPQALLHAALSLLLAQRLFPQGFLEVPRDFWALAAVWSLLAKGSAAAEGEKAALTLTDVQPLWLALSSRHNSKDKAGGDGSAGEADTQKTLEAEATKLLESFAAKMQK